jgi:hypothetical protein
LVCGPDNIGRNLAAFLGLPYDENMKFPHMSNRVAHTSSNEQVRRPIYTSSVGRFKQYSSDVKNTIDMEVEAESLGEDLEALAEKIGAFPAQAILRRVLRYENFPLDSYDPMNDEEFMHDLIRILPCKPQLETDDGIEGDWDSRGTIQRA